MKEQRYKDMLSTRSLVLQEFTNFKKLGYGNEINKKTLKLVKLKLKGLPIRAYYAQKICEYVFFLDDKIDILQENEVRQLFVKLALITELVLCIQYFDNQIFDRKGGVDFPEAITNNLLCGKFLKRHLKRYIRKNFTPYEKEKNKKNTLKKCSLQQILDNI